MAFALILTGAVSPTNPASAVGTGSLSGVISNETGAPVSGATVLLSCGKDDSLIPFYGSTTTNAEGAYAFSGLEARSCGLIVQKQGYAGINTLVQTAVGQVVSNLRIISPNGASITGSVLGALIGDLAEGVSGAELVLSFRDGKNFSTTTVTSEADGTFIFPAVPYSQAGIYSVRLTPGDAAPDYFPVEDLSIAVNPGVNVRNFSLLPLPVGTARLDGHVKAQGTGLPVSGALVTLEYSLSEGVNYARVSKTATTNADGLYVFEDIFSNSYYSISLSKAGYKTIERSGYRLRSGDSLRTRDFLMEIGPQGVGSFSVQVLNTDGQPLTNISVQASLMDGNFFMGVAATSGTNGTFIFEGLAEGEYSLSIEGYELENGRPIYRGYTGTFVLVANTAPTAEIITLDRFETGSARVSGQIHDSRLGTGIGGLGVTVSRLGDEQQVFRANTDATGFWSIADIPDGNYVATYSSDYRQVNNAQIDSAFEQLPSAFFSVIDEEDVSLERVEARSLPSSSGSLTVTVRNAKTREIITDASVYIYVENSNNTDQRASADPSGKVNFTNLYAADYKIAAGGSVILGAALQPQISIQPGSNKITIYAQTMENTGTIVGRITDAAGAPVVNAIVEARWSYNIGCCAGDGYSPWDITDAEGRYRIDEVTLSQELTLDVRSTQGMLQFATTAKKLKLRSATPVTENLVVTVGASVNGSAVLPAGVLSSGIQVELRDAFTGEWTAFTQLKSDGSYAFESVAVGTYNVLFTDAKWPLPARKLGSGYLAAAPGLPQVVSATSTGAYDLVVQDSVNYEFLPVTLRLGGSLKGQVKLKTGSERATLYAKDFFIRLYQLAGGEWLPYAQNQMNFSSGWQGGAFSVGGLPDGSYKFEVVDPLLITTIFDPVFSGQVATLDAADSFTIVNGATVAAPSVFMEVKRPTIEPSNSSWNALSSEGKEGLRNEVELVAGGSSGKKVRVGTALIGEWVAVTIESSASIARSSASARFSRAASVNFVIASAPAVSTWLQVNASGEVEVPSALGLSDDQKVIVLDSLNQVVGWATYAAPAQALPSVILNPVLPSVTLAPRMSVAPAISGTAKVGKMLAANLGRWAAAPAPSFSFQWYRCKKPTAKATTSVSGASCSPITRAQSRTYKLANRDAGYSVLARVTGKNSVGSKVVFTVSKKIGR